MIIVYINPAGIEAVHFQSNSELAEDLCLAAWPIIRKDLDRLDLKLRRTASKTLEMIEKDEASGR